jgi:uncharacterized OB-fold protein
MSGPHAEFLSYLAAGRFMIQRRRDDGRCVFYPRYTVGTEWDWVEASGRGRIYSRTIIRQKPERGGDYCVALVELQEGPRVMARIVARDPSSVCIGQDVEAVVGVRDPAIANEPHLSFRPIAADGDATP